MSDSLYVVANLNAEMLKKNSCHFLMLQRRIGTLAIKMIKSEFATKKKMI